MAAAQPARFNAPSDDIANWMAQRWRDIANLGPEAEDAGRSLWAQASRSGQDISAPNPSDVYALGAQFLNSGAVNSTAAPQQQSDPPPSDAPGARDNPTNDNDWSDYSWPGDGAVSPPAFVQGGLLQLTAAPGKGFWDYWGVPGCANCHGYTPDTLPPYGGQSSFPPNVIPRSGNSGGGGTPQTPEKYPQCEMQFRNDSGICAQQPTPNAQAVCMESAVQRQIWCEKHDGEIGQPSLFTAKRKSGRRWP
jgi:hypothetical protein